MASSNRHWPSMFKSKPCPQPWHDINTPPLLSTLAQKSGCEERSPEPKPRWNPRPEQIRILEAIFNSGMVNPPREEIHKIRLQLQQYGQVGDANVFYWFQNRKSRTKNKHRQQLSTRTNSRLSTGTNISNPNPNSNTSIVNVNIGVTSTSINVTAHNNTNSMASPSTPVTVPITMTAPTSSSSSSSERSSGSSKPLKPVHAPMSILDPVNHIYNHNVHGSVDFSNASDQPSFFFQNPHGYCFSIPELTGSTLISAPEQLSGLGLGLWSEPAMGSTSIVATGEEEEGGKFKNDGLGLWNDLVSQEAGCKGFVQGENGEDKVKIELHHECSFELTNPVVTSNVAESVITASVPAATRVTTASLVSEIQGFGNGGGRSNGVGGEARLTVFINDVAFDVPDTRLNVKAVFGLNAMLVHASGYPVPIDESANTLHPLQHGAAYYVV